LPKAKKLISAVVAIRGELRDYSRIYLADGTGMSRLRSLPSRRIAMTSDEICASSCANDSSLVPTPVAFNYIESSFFAVSRNLTSMAGSRFTPASITI